MKRPSILSPIKFPQLYFYTPILPNITENNLLCRTYTKHLTKLFFNSYRIFFKSYPIINERMCMRERTQSCESVAAGVEIKIPARTRPDIEQKYIIIE